MIPRHEITGAILAGGKSNRMGTNKALMSLNGRPMIQWIAGTMQGVFEEVVVVADEADAYRFLGLTVIPDIYKDSGPLAGIHAALKHSDARQIFFATCDTPFLSSELIRHIIASGTGSSVRIISDQGETHPLCGIYSKEILPVVQEMLDTRSLKVRDLLERTGASIVHLRPDLPFYNDTLLLNINNPDDYMRLHHLGLFKGDRRRQADVRD